MDNFLPIYLKALRDSRSEPPEPPKEPARELPQEAPETKSDEPIIGDSFTDAMERLIRKNKSDNPVRLLISKLFRSQSVDHLKNIQYIEMPVEKANPLAYAASVAYQSAVPQVMIQSAVLMVSPVTGMPVGLIGVHI